VSVWVEWVCKVPSSGRVFSVWCSGRRGGGCWIGRGGVKDGQRGPSRVGGGEGIGLTEAGRPLGSSALVAHRLYLQAVFFTMDADGSGTLSPDRAPAAAAAGCVCWGRGEGGRVGGGWGGC